MDTKTPTRVAEIAVEWEPRDASIDVAGRSGYEDRGPALARPSRIGLENDGCKPWWLDHTAVWTLAFDGLGWHATTDSPGWESAREHTYRLVDVDGPRGSLVGHLPTETGRVELDISKTYQLGLGANEACTGTVLWLSELG